MMKPKILITGATGKTGFSLAAELRTREWPVRAMVRREDARSASLQALGAEVVVADMYEPEQLFEAMKGTQRAYYLPLMRPYMIQAANAFAVAAHEAKLEAIVQMSQWTSSASHPTAMTRQIWLVDRIFSMIPGTAHIIFNPGMFADNFLRVIDFAALLGIFPTLMGESSSAPISNEDMARSAAVLLTEDPAKHTGRSYRPTGLELLSGKKMAAIIEKVVNHSVTPINLPTWMFRKVARMQGVDPYQIALLLQYVEDHKQGAFSFEGGVTQVMQELTGRAAESFETTARRYAAMPFARRTFANRLKAFANFAITPFYPGYNIKGYELSLELPKSPKPLHCMEDTRWTTSHAAQMALQKTSQSASDNMHASEARQLPEMTAVLSA